MRRHGDLFDRVVDAGNLWGAWREFRRGKRRRAGVQRFEVDADCQVLALHRSLAQGSYRPGPYRLLVVREPKTRVVAAAPVADRVVHHALHRVLAPLLDRGLIDTTYACLPGRGVHRAVIRFLAALREHRFALLLDVRHYFLTIDRRLLADLMARKLKDRRLLELLGVVLDSGTGLYQRPDVARLLHLPPGTPAAGCGLPIGNLTSQWWGNHYLSGLDHYLKRTLKLPHVQRYMDDITLFSDSRTQLIEARSQVARWLADERHQTLKHPQAPVRPTTTSFRYLGYRISRQGIDPGREPLRRMRRRLRWLALNDTPEALGRSLTSYRGLLGFPGVGTRTMTGLSTS